MSRRLYVLLLLPGELLLFFHFYGYALIEVLFLLDPGPRLGPFVACLALFLPPTIFLGAVSPYSVRLLVDESCPYRPLDRPALRLLYRRKCR